MQYFCNIFPDCGFSNLLHETEWGPFRRYMQKKGKTFVGCIGVQRHSNSKGQIMAVGDPHVFPCFLTPVLTQLFFPKPPTTFPTCFGRGERQKYAIKKSHLI